MFTSPPDVTASANLTVECLVRMVNETFISLGDRAAPAQTLSVTLDGASVNKNWLVLFILCLYVYHGVAEVCELEFLLQEHAHQIIDRFGWQHTRRVSESTYYDYEELEELIRAAHKPADPFRGVARWSPQAKRIFSVRDFWKVTNLKAEACPEPACYVYEDIEKFRAFRLKLAQDGGSGGTDPRGRTVTLETKQYMTDPNWVYQGTIIDRGLVEKFEEEVARAGGEIPLAPKKHQECKDEKEEVQRDHNKFLDGKTVQGLERILKGRHAAQYEGKLRDAFAIATGNYEHLFPEDDLSRGVKPTTMLPKSLATHLQSLASKRERGGGQSQDDPRVAQASLAEMHSHEARPGFMKPKGRGDDLPIPENAYAEPPFPGDWESFEAKPIDLGDFFLTAPLPGSKLPFEVYAVRAVHARGSALPAALVADHAGGPSAIADSGGRALAGNGGDRGLGCGVERLASSFELSEERRAEPRALLVAGAEAGAWP